MDEMNVIYVSDNESSLSTNFKNCTKITPSEPINFKYADLHHDDSGRSWIDGVMDVNIMRKDVISFDLVFNAISNETALLILQNLAPKVDGGFYASVFDFTTGTRKIIHAYRGDRNVTGHNYIGGNRVDLKVSLIQM
jgi:hypothetical protein